MKSLINPNEILKAIKAHIVDSNMSFSDIAFFSGVGKSTVRSTWDGTHIPFSVNIRKLAVFFKIEVGDFESDMVNRLKKSNIHYSYIANKAIVSDQYVLGIMNGRYKPSLLMCILLSNALDTLHKEHLLLKTRRNHGFNQKQTA